MEKINTVCDLLMEIYVFVDEMFAPNGNMVTLISGTHLRCIFAGYA